MWVRSPAAGLRPTPLTLGNMKNRMTTTWVLPLALISVLHSSFAGQLVKPDNDKLAAIALAAATNRFPQFRSEDLELQSVQYKYTPSFTNRPEYFGVTFIISSSKTNEETSAETVTRCQQIEVIILPDGTVPPYYVSQSRSESRHDKELGPGASSSTSVKSEEIK